MSVSCTTQSGRLQNLWSSDEGNYHASYRSNSPRRLIYQIKQYVPPPQTVKHELDKDIGSVILYVLPGVRCSSATKKLFWKLAKAKTPYPQRAEIEFSSVGLNSPSTPRAYKSRLSIGRCPSAARSCYVSIDRREARRAKPIRCSRRYNAFSVAVKRKYRSGRSF